MSTEYLNQRDQLYISKSRELLKILPPFVEDFYNSKEKAKKELTRHAYLLDLREFFEYLIINKDAKEKIGRNIDNIKDISTNELKRITVQDIDAYKNYLYGIGKTSSAKRKIATLSTFFKWLIKASYIENNPAALVDWPVLSDDKAIMYLSEEETKTLLNGILSNNKQIYYLDDDESETNIKGKRKNKTSKYVIKDISPATKKKRDKLVSRNFLITLLFLQTGIRVSELISIDLEDIDYNNTIINITGKGGKSRPVGYGNELTVNALNKYLSERANLLSKDRVNSNALFVSTGGKRMTVRMVETMIKEMVQTYLPDYARKDDFSPHKLRSTCATRLLKQTGDIKKVADLLGHENIALTAAVYTALNKQKNAEDLQGYDIY